MIAFFWSYANFHSLDFSYFFALVKRSPKKAQEVGKIPVSECRLCPYGSGTSMVPQPTVCQNLKKLVAQGVPGYGAQIVAPTPPTMQMTVAQPSSMRGR